VSSKECGADEGKKKRWPWGEEDHVKGAHSLFRRGKKKRKGSVMGVLEINYARKPERKRGWTTPRNRTSNLTSAKIGVGTEGKGSALEVEGCATFCSVYPLETQKLGKKSFLKGEKKRIAPEGTGMRDRKCKKRPSDIFWGTFGKNGKGRGLEKVWKICRTVTSPDVDA